MDQKSYQCNITANVTSQEAFNIISNNITEWWAEQFEGSANNLDDVFVVHFGEAEVTIKTVGFVPGRKIFWRVIDSNLPWLNNKSAWTDTQIVWQFLPGNHATEISMTHIGLIPETECYNDSVKSWNYFIKENLFNLLTSNKKETQPSNQREERVDTIDMSYSV
jgi:hypothetical protein